MPAIYTLEWTFTPADYFDREFEVEGPDYRIWFALGKATASADQEVYDFFNPDLRDIIERAVRNRLDGAQLVSRQAYELHGPSRALNHPDGRRDVFIEPGTGSIRVTGGSLDLVVTNSGGDVVRDTKRERADEKAEVGELLDKYRDRDDTVRAMEASFANSVRDPKNEFLHLYEIQEALVLRFGSKGKARAAIGVTAARWSHLGRLCNDEPLQQGRHRGKAGDALRDATEAELHEARSIAIESIRAYLKYLDTRPSSGP